MFKRIYKNGEITQTIHYKLPFIDNARFMARPLQGGHSFFAIKFLVFSRFSRSFKKMLTGFLSELKTNFEALQQFRRWLLNLVGITLPVFQDVPFNTFTNDHRDQIEQREK